MYYEDLTLFKDNPVYTGLNVGWLDGEHDFATGDTPDGFLDALFSAIASGKYTKCVAAGICHCSICGSTQAIVERNGDKIFMGNTEIAIPHEGVNYIAPSLIFHYVDEHRYLPPEPFLRGVLAAAAD